MEIQLTDAIPHLIWPESFYFEKRFEGDHKYETVEQQKEACLTIRVIKQWLQVSFCL